MKRVKLAGEMETDREIDVICCEVPGKMEVYDEIRGGREAGIVQEGR